MKDLNQFVIGRALGSTMTHTRRPRIGPRGVLHAQNQVLALKPRQGDQITFGPQAEKLILRAFEESREGLPLERLLADPALTRKLLRRAKELGVIAAPHAILLRLFRFRKTPRGKLRLSKPTTVEPRRDHTPYIHAAEMALTQLRYRHGVSVDDILAYPDIGGEFDRLCETICPGYDAVDYRLAALHIRKSRSQPKEGERSLFDSLDLSDAEAVEKRSDTLNTIAPADYSGLHGVVTIVEEGKKKRYLYVSGTTDAAVLARSFSDPRTLMAVSNSFWKPDLSCIRLSAYAIGDRFEGVSQSLWLKRWIAQKTPIFNQPIHVTDENE